MKENLVDLLLEEYKQMSLFNELSTKGIELSNVLVKNSNIVLDLIGFPKDNSREYDLYVIDGLNHDPKRGRYPDKNLFIRDWLFDEYYKIIDSIEMKQDITVTDKGLKVTEEKDELVIKQKLDEYINWLFVEYKNLGRNKSDSQI